MVRSVHREALVLGLMYVAVCCTTMQALTHNGGQTNSTLTFNCSEGTNSCRSPARCTTRLESEQGETPPKCYCDSYCTSLNDCCYDYVSSCNITQHNIYLAAQQTRYALQTKNWSCFEYSKTSRSPGIWMVASCPPQTDHALRSPCEEGANSSAFDFLRYVPTTHCYKNSGECVTFRNIYCARCNMVNNPIFWKLIWRCGISPPRHYSNDEKNKFLLDNCPGFRVEPHPTSKKRFCYPVVSNCSEPVDAKVAEDCLKGYSRLLYHKPTDKHYKNPSCLLCNGHLLDNTTCGPSEFSTNIFKPKSFEMVMQFHSYPWSNDVKITRTVKQSCGEKMVYDPFLEDCRVGTPPDPVQSILDKFRFKVWIKPKRSSTTLQVVDNEDVKNALQETFQLPSQSVSMIGLKKDENALSAVFDLQATADSNASSVNSTTSLPVLDNLFYFRHPFELTIQRQTWIVFKVTHKRMACSRPEIIPPVNFTQSGSNIFINNQTHVKVNASNVYFITRNHTERGILAGSLFICKSFFTEACSVGQVLLELGSTDYTLLNGSLLFKAAGRLYAYGSYELQNNTAWVCTNYTNATIETKKPWVRTWPDDQVLWYITVCGLPLSIISLAFLLVTYASFKELRTMPGKNLMSLSISIMLSQLIWLLESGDTGNQALCKAAAVTLHYLFLVSFTCMAVIAYDTRRAFPKNDAQMTHTSFPSSSKKRFWVYLLFSWGVPMVFVIICFIIDQQRVMDIGYGNSVICWLTDMTAQIVLFGVPVGLLLLYNLWSFICTVQAIRSTKIGSKRLQRQGANQGHEVKIYFRLMTLMGFTWFFGFGAHALHRFLMYAFVVLTSLHGVYIALAFVLKPHVFNLFKNRLANMNFNRKSTISTIDLTMSTPSKGAESVL